VSKKKKPAAADAPKADAETVVVAEHTRKKVKRRPAQVVGVPVKPGDGDELYDLNDEPKPAAPEEPEEAEELEEATAEIPQSPPPAAPAAPKPPAPGHSHPALLEKLAREYGVPDSDIAKTPTAELERLVDYLHERETSRRHAVQNQPPAAPNAQAAPPEAQAEPEEDLGLDMDDPAQWDQDLNGRLKKVLGGMSKRIRHLEGMLAAQAADRTMSLLDAAFSKHPHIFGSGSSAVLDPKSPEAARRRVAYKELVDLKAQNRLTSPDADVESIASTIFAGVAKPAPASPPPPPAPTPAQAAVEARKGAWSNGVVARPTERAATAKNGTPEERAAAAVRERLRSRGVAVEPESGGSEDLDYLE
jgi:transcriptional regulator with XRE-family HTH domain